MVKHSVKYSAENVKIITIICGSESDLPITKSVVSLVPPTKAKITVHVISCHRNFYELEILVKTHCGYVDAVIGIGSKALALPGIVAAILQANFKDTPVIGVALGEPESEAFLAAKLSIEELPDKSVIVDETGNCYAGCEGILQAIERIIAGTLPPPKPRTEKPVLMYAFKNF